MKQANIGSGITLYDYLLVRGGAEQVAIDTSKYFKVPLCVGFVDRGIFPTPMLSDLDVIEVETKSSWHAAMLVRTLRGFRRKPIRLGLRDWAIYSGSCAPLAVHRDFANRNIHYCHTIPRFAYDLKEWYLDRVPMWQRPALAALACYIRRQYESAARRMDLTLVNSNTVKHRLECYLNIEAQVIHPPCEVDRFCWMGQGDYYLSSARLEPYKRVERIVAAFLQMPNRKLIVVSGGSQLKRLQALADGATNIRFTGWVQRHEMARLVGNAIATIYIPVEEDFGMSPVESMAAGKPVIGVAEGGLIETVVDGQTGILLEPNPSLEDIMGAVSRLTPEQAVSMRQACENRAMRFHPDVFFGKLEQAIGDL